MNDSLKKLTLKFYQYQSVVKICVDLFYEAKQIKLKQISNTKLYQVVVIFSFTEQTIFHKHFSFE